MAVLLDTSALVVFLRSAHPSAAHGRVARVVREELQGGSGVVSALTALELLVGARDARGRERLEALLERLPLVGLEREVAVLAGSLGAYLGRRGAPIPQVDLGIAATALWLELPLLTCDGDFFRARQVALNEGGTRAGGEEARTEREVEEAAGGAWRSLQLHPASLP